MRTSFSMTIRTPESYLYIDREEAHSLYALECFYTTSNSFREEENAVEDSLSSWAIFFTFANPIV